MALSAPLQKSFLSPLLGFLRRTDIRFLVLSKGNTCSTWKLTVPSPGSETVTVVGVLLTRRQL